MPRRAPVVSSGRSPDGASPARLARIALAACLAAGGCGGDADYDQAARTGTAAAWNAYLRAHPDSGHAQDAQARLAALEDGDWQRAHASDTPAAYQQYLRSYPQGAHAHDALVAIANLNLGAPPAAAAPGEAPATAAPPPVGTAVTAPAAQQPGAGASAATGAASQPRAPGRYRVQLGALRDRATAERVWGELVARYPGLAAQSPLIGTARTANGREVFRLQVAGLERAAAESLCATLAAGQDPCILIAPPPAAAEPPR